MARVTVEDCVTKIPNRFELVLTAAHRAREIASGSLITVDRDRDKNPVVALREIADSTISIETTQENLITKLQKVSPPSEGEEDLESFLAKEAAGESTFDPDAQLKSSASLMAAQKPEASIKPAADADGDAEEINAEFDSLQTLPEGELPEAEEGTI